MWLSRDPTLLPVSHGCLGLVVLLHACVRVGSPVCGCAVTGDLSWGNPVAFIIVKNIVA